MTQHDRKQHDPKQYDPTQLRALAEAMGQLAGFGLVDTGPVAVTAAAAVEIEHEPVPEDQLVAGDPHTGTTVLGQFGEHEVGVWEMTPGTMSDCEVDEVFVVISGAATVVIEGQDEPLVLSAGDVVTLREDMLTEWTVTETLRKVYIA